MEKDVINQGSIENKGDEMDAATFVAKLNEINANKVDKALYDKVVANNATLANALANGQSMKQETQEETPVDINALRKELYGGDFTGTNIEYIEKTLKLREALIKKGEDDPFLPIGKRISPTEDDIAAAQRVEDGLRACLENADEDNFIFTNELQRIMRDVNFR